MATTHASGTGIGPGDAGRHGRRAAVIAGIVLACAAIVVPFGLHGVQRSGAHASTATPVTTGPSPALHHPSVVDPASGSPADLPALLPSRSAGPRDGLRVRIGDVTDGTLRRTPPAGWQVVVRWDGRLQPLTTRGPVSLTDGTSWVARSGLLYTRVATATAGRFDVYAWVPEGGTAYTPPTLVADDLGRVCFDPSFTAFGDCPRPG
jgi:hypothetical protein